MFKSLLNILSTLLLGVSHLSASDGLRNVEAYTKNSNLQSKWAIESLEVFPFEKTDRVLDIGCGDGFITAKIAAQVPLGIVVGLDISKEMLMYAETHHVAPNLLYVHGDARQPLFIEQFDKVVAFLSLNWIKEQEQVLHALYTALKPGGRAIITRPGKQPTNLGPLVQMLVKTDRWVHYFPHFEQKKYYYSAEEYSILLENAGFVIEKISQDLTSTLFKDKEALIGFFRPLCNCIDHLPPVLQQLFVEDIVNALLEINPSLPDGSIQLHDLKLEALISRPVNPLAMYTERDSRIGFKEKAQLLGPLLIAQSQPPQGFVPAAFSDSMAWKRKPTTREVQLDPAVNVAAKNFERFCNGVASQPPIDYSRPPSNPSIPSLIHFVWLGTPVPPEGDAVIQSWRDCHPGWVIKVWTEKDADQILEKTPRLLNAFHAAETYAEKSDILRLQILNEVGGIYADTDAVCLKPFHDVTTQGFTFVGGIQMNYIWEPAPGGERKVPLGMGTAIMAAAPGSSVIKYCLDHYRTQEEAPGVNLVMRAGPGLLGRACAAALLNDEEHLRVLTLPCSYLFPFPFEDKAAFFPRDETLTPTEKVAALAEMASHFVGTESLAVHLWVGSWLSEDIHRQIADFVRLHFFAQSKQA